MATKKSAEPWDKPAPKKSKHTKLTPASKAKAKASAKKAGRSYPNLVDNMNAAKKQSGSSTKKAPSKTKSVAAKKSPKRAASKSKAPAKPKKTGAKKS